MTKVLTQLSDESASYDSWEGLRTAMLAILHVGGMEQMAAQGEEYEWGPAAILSAKAPPKHMEGKKPFWAWLMANGPAPVKMNCWEAVLFAAFNAGVIGKPYIKKILYRQEGLTLLVRAIIGSPAGRIEKTSGKDRPTLDANMMIPRGHVVLFSDDGEHVALSTGSTASIKSKAAVEKAGTDVGHEIMELDKPTSGVEKTTVEDTMDRGGSAYRRAITWAALPDI